MADTNSAENSSESYWLQGEGSLGTDSGRGQQLRPLLIDLDGWDYRGKPLDFNGIYQGLYGHSIFQTGETLIPRQVALEMRLGHVGDAAWQQAFRRAYLEGLKADVRDRSWSKAEAHYLACWQLLQEELGLRNFPRCLAVMAWLRGYFSSEGACWQMLLHRSQVLYQWSCVEEMAGNHSLARSLEERAMELEDQVEVAPPMDLRLFFCTGLAHMVSVCGAPGEARWWMHKGWEYCTSDDVEPSAWEEAARSLQPMHLPPDDDAAPCSCGRSWCSAEREMAERKELALMTPSYAHLRWPLAPDEDLEEFYPATGPPEFPPAEVVSEKLQELPGGLWREEFAVHYQAGHTMEEEESWSSSISHYLVCKHMIEKRCQGRMILAIYKWLSCLIGTRLAFLYQCRLGDFEKCVAILDWLLALVEPQHFCLQLFMHRSVVLYQWSCHVAEGEGCAASMAERLLQEAMEVKQVIGLTLSPVPNMVALLCLLLAYYSEHDARKWLNKASEHVVSGLHSQWEMMLQWHQVLILFNQLEAWEEAKQLLLDFKEAKLDIATEEIKEQWTLEVLSTGLTCIVNVNEKGLRGDRGVWWTGDVAVSDKPSPHFDTVRLAQELEAFAEHSQPWQPRFVTKHWNQSQLGWWSDYSRARHGFSAYNSLRTATGSREVELKYLEKEILCGKTCLEISQNYRRGMVQFWHGELGKCYSRAGYLTEGLLEDTLASASPGRQGKGGNAYKRKARSNYQASKDHLLIVVADDSTVWLRSDRGAKKYVSKHELKMEAFFAFCGLLRIQGHHLLRTVEQLFEKSGKEMGAARAARLYLNDKVNNTGEYSDHTDDAGSDNSGDSDDFSDGPNEYEYENGGCNINKDVISLGIYQLQSYFAAFQEAKDYYELPVPPNFSDDEFIYLIERREEAGSILHMWSKAIDSKKHVLSIILQTYGEVMPSTILKEVALQHSDCDKERFLMLEQSLHNYFAFQWSHMYNEDVQPTWMDMYSNDEHVWNIIPEDEKFGENATCVVYQVVDEHYYGLGGGLLTIFVIQTMMAEEKEPFSNIETFSIKVNTQEIESILNDIRSCASQEEDEVVDRIQKTYDAMLQRLYDIFVMPISHVLERMEEEEKLIFVGDNYLAGIPFSLLLNGKTKEYLFQRHTISICPSIMALRHCHERFCALEKEDQAEIGLAVANPAYGTGRKALRELPMSGEEIKVIQDIFRDTKMQVVTMEGLDANVQSFLEKVERPEKKGFVHMAVHAGTEPKKIVDQLGLSRGVIKQGTVYLAPVVRTRRNGKRKVISGTLTMDDIFRRGKKWNACMVVLSACESSQGQVLESGSLLNLPQALMLVGVPCIVAAQWKVPDGRSTLQCVELLYRNLRRGLDASSALRNAMQTMLRDGAYHMSQWGAFLVWGLPTVHLARGTLDSHPAHSLKAESKSLSNKKQRH